MNICLNLTFPQRVIRILSVLDTNRRLANELTVATVVKNLNMCNRVFGKVPS